MPKLVLRPVSAFQAMAGNRRRHLRRRKSWEYGDGAILLRVGSRRSLRHFHEISVTGRRDAPRFARLIEDQVRAFPRDPLIISVNGYQPWLQEILSSCIDDYWSDISDLDREVQFASTMSVEPSFSSSRPTQLLTVVFNALGSFRNEPRSVAETYPGRSLQIT